MKIKLLAGVTLAFCTLLIIAGCASQSVGTAAFNTETTVAATATGATHAFNVYLNEQANPSPSLLEAKTNLYTADVDLSKTLAITEAIREEYMTNSTSTNAAALSVALTAVELQATNIVQLAQQIITTLK